MCSRLLVLLLMLAWPTLAWSTTYYIDINSGNNGKSCSAATNATTPKKLFNADANGPGGTSCLSGGDTLIVKDGTYPECLADVLPSGLSASQPTTIKADNRRRAILTGQGGQCSAAIIQLGQNNVLSSVKHYITIDGFVLDIALDCECMGLKVMGGSGADVRDGAHDIHILNNEIRGGRNSGNVSNFSIGFGQAGNQYGWTVRGNYIHDIGQANALASDAAAWSYGMYMSGGDNLIEDNEIARASAFGLHGNSPSNHLYKNIIRNNYWHDNGGPALLICGHDNQVYNNVFARNGISPDYKDRGAVVLALNCSGVPSPNNLIAHNTFVLNRGDKSGGPSERAITLSSAGRGSAAHNIVRNNLFWRNVIGKGDFDASPGTPDDTLNNSSGDAATNVIDHNLCAGVLGTGSCGGVTYADPRFRATIPDSDLTAAGITRDDFQLQSGSPAINAGVSVGGITTDMGGSARDSHPDLGAWEFGGGMPPTHRVCQHGSCVSVSGAGTDACTLGASCTELSPTTSSSVHWPLDECGGTQATDTSGSNVLGTITGSPAWITGKVGACALRLLDAPTYVANPGMTWAPQQPVTVTFWILAHPCSGGGCGTFTLGGQASPQTFLAFVPWGDNMLYFEYGDIGAGGLVSTNFSAYLGKWTFVALVSDGRTLQAIYLNGALVTSGTPASAPTQALTGLEVGRIASAALGGPRYANADIDEFHLVNQALTADEIAQLYGGGRPRRHPTSTALH